MVENQINYNKENIYLDFVYNNYILDVLLQSFI